MDFPAIWDTKDLMKTEKADRSQHVFLECVCPVLFFSVPNLKLQGRVFSFFAPPTHQKKEKRSGALRSTILPTEMTVAFLVCVLKEDDDPAL